MLVCVQTWNLEFGVLALKFCVFGARGDQYCCPKSWSPECYANPFQYGLCNMQALLPHRHMWTKLLFFPSTGAVQSSIGCLCQSTRAAAATAVPLSTNSPSAATITSGRGHQAALSNLWLPRHSPTHPTEPSASVAQWERRCQPRGWRGVVSSRGALAAMDDL